MLQIQALSKPLSGVFLQELCEIGSWVQGKTLSLSLPKDALRGEFNHLQTPGNGHQRDVLGNSQQWEKRQLAPTPVLDIKESSRLKIH